MLTNLDSHSHARALPWQFLALLFGILMLAPICSAQANLPADLGAAEYYRPPQLTLMTGFIKDPQHEGFSVWEWSRGIGKNFDAKALVSRIKSAGFSSIIWYDKWIDGLVFRKTKTTKFVTEKDFLAELAPECKRQGVKLVIYFNTFYDGNPEFEKWAVVDQRGKPMAFSPFWPCNMLSMYSPFREAVKEQIRELLIDYDVDGLWLDVPGYSSVSYDKWTREAFKKQMGKDLEAASPEERRLFTISSVVNWNKEVAAFIRKTKPSATVTTNRYVNALSEGPFSAIGMAEPLDYFSTEMHTNKLQLESAPVLSEYIKPVEVASLISDTWFTPLNSGPVKTSKHPNVMQAELAAVLGGGTNMYLALTLAHDGSAHEGTLQVVDLAGKWLRERRPYIEGTENYADVGIALGTANEKDIVWPGGDSGYSGEILALEENLRGNGHLARRMLNCANVMEWGVIPTETRTLIVPDRVSLTPADADKIRAFARNGGKVVAFRRGTGLSVSGGTATVDELFGLHTAGLVTPGNKLGLAVEIDGKESNVSTNPLHLRPDTAEVLLWTWSQREGQMPLLTRNRVGKGVAYVVSATETDVLANKDVAVHIWREVIGKPLWKTGDTSGRYTLRLRKQKSRIIAHLMDSMGTDEGPMHRYRALYTNLALNRDLLSFEKATIVPDDRNLKVDKKGGWSTVEVYVDPELTIVLE